MSNKSLKSGQNLRAHMTHFRRPSHILCFVVKATQRAEQCNLHEQKDYETVILLFLSNS